MCTGNMHISCGVSQAIFLKNVTLEVARSTVVRSFLKGVHALLYRSTELNTGVENANRLLCFGFLHHDADWFPGRWYYAVQHGR